MQRLLFLGLIFLLLTAGAGDGESQSRLLDFDYEVEIRDIPARTFEVKIWLPRPAQRPYQEIESFSLDPQEGAQISHDKTYQNAIIYYRFKAPKDTIKINARYLIKRYAYSKNSVCGFCKAPGLPEGPAKYLVSNKLMVVSAEIRKMAQDITKGKKTTMDKARALYNYVFENVSYNKTIPGWGQGDTHRVCLIKTGNCTDFHSLFISLARSIGIPAKFVMGVVVPKGQKGEITGYHCWAEFYDRRLGWVPVDISEAWKDKPKKEYYFGAVDENRVELTEGRDIVLEPAAGSAALNYFFYPYVEIDGKEYQNAAVLLRFKDRAV